MAHVWAVADVFGKDQDQGHQSGFVVHDLGVYEGSFVLMCWVVSQGFLFQAFPKDIKNYDPDDSAWPGKLDEFAAVS